MNNYHIGNSEYFPNIGKITYEGPESDNPLAFKFYDPDRIIAGKPMKEHLRFSIAYWHSFCANGSDPFGAPTLKFPWDTDDLLQSAKNRADAAFEFITKIGAPYYAFHDADVAPQGTSATEYVDNYRLIAEYLKEL